MNFRKIKFIGRHIKKEDGEYFSYSGCGFEFCALPKKENWSFVLSLVCELREYECQYIAIYLNKKLFSIEKIVEGENKVSINLTNKKVSNIRVIKLNETYLSSITLKSIEFCGAELGSLEKINKKKIGFYGDSVTCGFGNLDFHGLEFKMETEDFRKTYAYLTADALDMDYSVVARGGISISIPIYNDKLIGDIYDTVDMFEKCDPELDLDYAVINLGANDNSGYLQLKDIESKTKALALFKSRYFDLIERIIFNNPNVIVILMYHMLPLESGIIDAIKSTYQKARSNFQNKFILLECTENTDGGCCHPYFTGHEEASKLLIKVIKRYE